jgi:DNA-binding transcriptional MocR family regulator
MPLINKNSAIPYYKQLADLLRGDINANLPACGGIYPLPSENELAEQHGINRATVRHALDVLEREGRIYREKGKAQIGNFNFSIGAIACGFLAWRGVIQRNSRASSFNFTRGLPAQRHV